MRSPSRCSPASSRSSPRASFLSSRATSRPFRRSRRTGWGSRGRHDASSCRASPSFSASRHSLCSSASGPASSGGGSSATSSCSRRSPGSCSSCSGWRSSACCPGPSVCSAQASSREREAADRASSSARLSPSVPRRASGPCSLRFWCSPARQTRPPKARCSSASTPSDSRSRSSSPARCSHGRWTRSAACGATTARSRSPAAPSWLRSACCSSSSASTSCACT